LTDRTYVFVVNSLDAGGVERSLVELLPRLAESGVRAVLVCLRRGGRFDVAASDAGYEIRYLSSPGRLAQIVELRRIIRQLEPALLYTALFEADLTGRLAAFGTGVPVITNLANTTYDPIRLQDPNVRSWRLRVVKAVDGFTARHLTHHFHAVSHAVKASAVATMGLDPDVVTVVHRGRERHRLGEISQERRNRVRASLEIGPEVDVLMTAGRQEYQKGHSLLLAAFNGVRAARPGTILLVAGRPGHASAELESIVEGLGLEDCVRLLGHRDDVTDLMAASDLFVFPSLYEGLGGAMIEAMALGLPIVASDLPALREVAIEDQNAILVPPNDVEALEWAMLDLLADPARRTEYGRVSQKIFEDRFEAAAATEGMLSMLENVSRNSTAPAPIDTLEVMERIEILSEGRMVKGAGPWDSVGEWESFKARFIHLRSRRGDEVALKLGVGWSADDAQYVSHEVTRVRSMLQDLPGGEVVMPEAIGWSRRPPAVLLRFAPGTNLFRWLIDTHAGGGRSSHQEMIDLTTMCGQAIGAYHSSEPAGAAPDDDHQIALDDLLNAVRRAGFRRQSILSIEPRLIRARGYRFSANDFTVDAAGRLVMHDPPHVRKFDYTHRDVSGFTYDLHRLLLGNQPFDSEHPRAQLTLQLRDAFLSGYAITGPSSLATPMDDWVIRLFEYTRILGRARGVIRRRQLTELPNQLQWAIQQRRALGRRPMTG
jgi:glycosyltransferase involved in cell wall biosynthesis